MQAQIPASEYNALLDLYDASSGFSWANKSGWLDAEAASWYGVTVTEGHVVEINLDQNKLTGTMSGDLDNLSQLQSLDLGNNELSGSIPGILGNLTQLQYLDLNNNELSGSIPESLGNLAQLQYLFLDVNELSGSIPSGLGNLHLLLDLFLQFNQLSGDVPEFSAFSTVAIGLDMNNLNVAPGSQSLANIDAMIANGVEIDFLPQLSSGCLGQIVLQSDGSPWVYLSGGPGQYVIQVSSNLTTWAFLINVELTSPGGNFVDASVTNYPCRFYTVVLP